MFFQILHNALRVFQIVSIEHIAILTHYLVVLVVLKFGSIHSFKVCFFSFLLIKVSTELHILNYYSCKYNRNHEITYHYRSAVCFMLYLLCSKN